MAQTCPKPLIPLGEAFGSALYDAPGYLVAVRQTGEANSEAERELAFSQVDEIGRRIERRMREALADGRLPMFIRLADGSFERLIEREAWREAAFGLPNIDSVPEVVVSPGGDTDGRAVFLKICDFEKWRAADIDPYHTGAPGKPTAMHQVVIEHQWRLDCGEALRSVAKEAEWLKEWLGREHPVAPPTTAKTIENRIRENHRKHRWPVAAA
jgi:hypothetical protein